MPFSNNKHRWIRRKLGPDEGVNRKKPKVELPPNVDDDNNEIISVEDNIKKTPSPEPPGLDVVNGSREEDVKPKNISADGGIIVEPHLADDHIDTKENNSDAGNMQVEDDIGNNESENEDDLEGVDIGSQSSYGIRSLSSSDDDINRIKSAVIRDINTTVNREVSRIETKIENERNYYSRFSWWRFLCCLLIIGLLLWILYCLYFSCRQDSAVTTPLVKKYYITKKIYLEKNCTDKPKGQDIEKLKGLFKARILTKTVEPELLEIPSGKIEYMDTNGNLKSINVDTFEVIKNEISIKDYFYFANDTKMYPAFWDNGSEDIRKNPNSSYQYSCLDDESCPVVGISVKDAKEYVKWLNLRIKDGRYSLMTEAQWHRFASYVNINKEAWYIENSDGKAHTVRSKRANKYGVYDSYGNVAELCRIDKDKYIVVGGAWNSSENELSRKFTVNVSDKNNWTGFRLVKTYKKDQK